MAVVTLRMGSEEMIVEAKYISGMPFARGPS
jgi:hypothetical protein